jgi:D-3-phosphoglycerate dehydrogenase / 2-oxoglutarate reductase
MKPRLLIAESNGFSESARKTLEVAYEVEYADLDRDGLLRAIGDFDAVWVRLRNMIDQEILSAGKRLKVLATNTTGLNHVDLEEAERRGIRVISLRGEVDFLKTIRATAELTIGLTLAVLRRIPAAHQHVLGGGWDRTLFSGSEIYDKTVGIVGYGRLGKIVADLFSAFGARVLVNDPRLNATPQIDGYQVCSLGELLAESQIVSLHANYLVENHHFFGGQQFAAMQQGSIFINTARGELVDEHALITAIESEVLAGAGIDVVDKEHAPTTTLEKLRGLARRGKNLVFTPHLGGNTKESLERTERFLAQKLTECNWVR